MSSNQEVLNCILQNPKESLIVGASMLVPESVLFIIATSILPMPKSSRFIMDYFLKPNSLWSINVAASARKKQDIPACRDSILNMLRLNHFGQQMKQHIDNKNAQEMDSSMSSKHKWYHNKWFQHKGASPTISTHHPQNTMVHKIQRQLCMDSKIRIPMTRFHDIIRLTKREIIHRLRSFGTSCDNGHSLTDILARLWIGDKVHEEEKLMFIVVCCTKSDWFVGFPFDPKENETIDMNETINRIYYIKCNECGHVMRTSIDSKKRFYHEDTVSCCSLKKKKANYKKFSYFVSMISYNEMRAQNGTNNKKKRWLEKISINGTNNSVNETMARNDIFETNNKWNVIKKKRKKKRNYLEMSAMDSDNDNESDTKGRVTKRRRLK